MLSDVQLMMFILFGTTIALVLVAEWSTLLPLKRATALASIASVTAAIFCLASDPPKGGEWQALTWELQGKPAKKKHRTAYVRTGDDDTEEEGETRYVEDPRSNAMVSGDTTAEKFERFMVAAFKTPQKSGLAAGDVQRDCPECPEMIVVPAGTFQIGASEFDPVATAAERPASNVKIWPGFLMGKSEVTAAEYAIFARATNRAPSPCQLGASERGVAAATCVTSADARAYTLWLRRMTGKTYRLPSAAEWEYAARAADEPKGFAEAAMVHPAASQVGAQRAHPWGFSGLGGDVAEMTADCWQSDLSRVSSTGEAFETEKPCPTRVLKDGSTSEPARWQRPSARRPLPIEVATPTVGFRVVRAPR